MPVPSSIRITQSPNGEILALHAALSVQKEENNLIAKHDLERKRAANHGNAVDSIKLRNLNGLI